MQFRETKKLFYDEYAYKLVIKNSLAYIFRQKNFNTAKKNLDYLQTLYDQNEPLILYKSAFRKNTYHEDAFLNCKILYNEFIERSDYKIRIELSYISIYSNDRDWLLSLASKIENTFEFWEPKYVLDKNTIILDRYIPYQYRVTMGKSVDPGLAGWIRKNPDKVRAGNHALREIEKGSHVGGLYFYVRDNKVLNLISLFLSRSCRVDKIIIKQDLDK